MFKNKALFSDFDRGSRSTSSPAAEKKTQTNETGETLVDQTAHKGATGDINSII